MIVIGIIILVFLVILWPFMVALARNISDVWRFRK